MKDYSKIAELSHHPDEVKKFKKKMTSKEKIKHVINDIILIGLPRFRR